MASMKSAWLQFFAVVVLLLAFFAIGSLVYAEPPVITVVRVVDLGSSPCLEIDWSYYEREQILSLMQRYRPREDVANLRALCDLIVETAARYELRATFVAQVIACESEFNPRAVSRCGARGLMQIMPYHKLRDHFDQAENLDYGCKYLRNQLNHFGSEALALAAYNAGPGRVARLGRVPDIPETQAYVRRVLAGEKKLRGIMAVPAKEEVPEQ